MTDAGLDWDQLQRVQPIDVFAAGPAGLARAHPGDLAVKEAGIILAALDNDAGKMLVAWLTDRVVLTRPVHPAEAEAESYGLLMAHDAGRRSVVLEMREMVATARETLAAARRSEGV